MFGTLLKSSNSTGSLSVMISAAPVITIMLSMSFLDEEFELKHFVATLLTLSGLALFNVK
jgi:drug/metabolite transporter (DMT)-like permease